jgi:hypothetical protein
MPSADRNIDRGYRNLVAWLSPLSFGAKQNDLFSSWKEGTGKWLFEADLFKAWLNGEEKFLWCPGIRLSPIGLINLGLR